MMMFVEFLKTLLAPINNEEGQGMVEYALLIALIAIVVMAVLLFLGPAIAVRFQEVIDAL